MKHAINGRIILETTNGITIEYMGRLILIVLYSEGTKPLLTGDGITVRNKLNLEGELIVREMEYSVTKYGTVILSLTGIDGITRQLKLTPTSLKKPFSVNVIDFLQKEKGEEDYVKRVRFN